MSRDQEPVIVYDGTVGDAEVLKSLLEASGIAAYLQNERMGTLAPWFVSPAGAGGVKVMVAHENAVEAQSIVEDFVRRQGASS